MSQQYTTSHCAVSVQQSYNSMRLNETNRAPGTWPRPLVSVETDSLSNFVNTIHDHFTNGQTYTKPKDLSQGSYRSGGACACAGGWGPRSSTRDSAARSWRWSQATQSLLQQRCTLRRMPETDTIPGTGIKEAFRAVYCQFFCVCRVPDA